MSDLGTSNIITLAIAKKVLLEEILSLTEEQINAIKDEKFEKLERLLDEKDLLIEKINDVDLKFRKLKSEEPIENQGLLSILLQIQEVLGQIKTLDDTNNEELSKSMIGIQEGLKEVRQGKRAMNNYSNSDPYHAFASQGGTLFIDQDS